MSRSLQSNIKVGRVRGIWNETFKRMDYYKRTTRGKFIMCNQWSGRFIMKGPGLASKQLDALLKQ